MYMFIGNLKNGDLIIITDIERFNVHDGIIRLYHSDRLIPAMIIDDFKNLKLKYIEKGE